MSILSFPDRGDGGDAGYPGNLSPRVYEWLIRETGATSLLDPTLGSGTGVEVALEMGLRAAGSDLARKPYHQGVKRKLEARGARVELGVDATKASLADLFGLSDLVVAHPAYGTQKRYRAGLGDMSELGDGEDFLCALQAMALNMREATRRGGHYVIVLGDTRRKGAYHSYQGPLIGMLPASELRAVRIKAQHGVSSAGTDYGALKFGLTLHEYVLIWERGGSLYHAFSEIARAQQLRLTGTWKAIVRQALAHLGGEADHAQLYDLVFRSAPERVRDNPNYQAKVRQTLQLLPDVEAVGVGRSRLVA